MIIPPVPGPSIAIAFDFNKAPANALRVPSEPNALGVKAFFTTNASQWEPGEFVNGVVSFGPNENVSILHNAGTAQGSNQRYVAVKLESPVALLLQGMRFRSHTNAFGCSPENPVILAVETATRDDFADATVLGTIPTFGGPLAEKSLPLGVRLPAGPINIRLRSTSPVPDGSNYIAYIDFALAVSPLQSGQPPVIQPHADVGPIQATSADGAIVTYDPALAKDDSGAAPTITYSQESGTLFPIGPTTVTVTAKDAANKTATSTFTVTVVGTPHLVVEQPPGMPLASGSAIVAWGYNQFGQTNVPDGLTDVREIAAGLGHTVALKSDGTVLAWGDNSWGQRNMPGGLAGVKAIAAGAYHTVALKNDGTVLAWGVGSFGQTNVPGGLAGVKAIAAGWSHTLALKNDGTLIAWGDSSLGQTNVPSGLAGVKAIAAGYNHTVALKSDGTVLAWGDNNAGQTSVPSQLRDVQAIAAGGRRTVALKNDGTIVAWGFSFDGQTNVPDGLTDVQAIAAGDGQTVALKSDGTVLAWGNNSFGQTSVPDGLRGVRAIASGGNHTVALVRASVDFASQQMGESSAAKTFLLKNTGFGALNISGAIVTGENPGDFSVDTRSMAPRVAPGTETALSVTFKPSAIGHRSATLRVASNDSAKPNYDIALTGEGVDVTPPTIQAHADVGPIVATSAEGAIVTYEPVMAKDDSGTEPVITYSQESGTLFPIGTTIVNVTAKDAANNMARAQFKVTVVAAPRLVIEQPAGTPLQRRDPVVAWGFNYSAPTSVPAGLTNVRAIVAGNIFSWAFKTDGTAVMWTSNDSGPLIVDGGQFTDVIAMATGMSFTVRLKKDGTVTAVGNRLLGQTDVPRGVNSVQAIAAGMHHTLALRNDGTLIAWGDNSRGQSSVPGGLTDVQAIAAGNEHSVALKKDGTVLAWGGNDAGQTNVPEGLTRVTGIAAYGNRTIALKEDGTVVSWGADQSGETSPPVGLRGVRAIAAGLRHAVALKRDGTVIAWGNNREGETNVPAGLTGVQAIAAGSDHTVALVPEIPNVIFDGQEPGISTAAKIFTLKNAGSGPLVIGGIMVTGDNAGDFTIDTRAMAGSLAPGGETTFSVTFTPRAIGNRAAILRVASNDAATPTFDIALSGVGFDAPPMIAPHENVGPIEATSSAGAIVTYEPAMVTGVVQTITYSQESGTMFPIGVTTVTITGTDAANRTATATFTVAVTGSPHLAIEQPAGTPLLEGTRVAAWGSHSQNQTKAPDGLTDIEAIAAGGYHTVALKKDGTVLAWGATGQERSNVPVGLIGVQVIAAGRFHTLALTNDGVVVAWGDNSQGQTTVPNGVRAVRAVAAGGYHSVALNNNGAVVAWGDNSCGQINVPIGLTDVRAIAAGQFHTVALRHDGTVVSWGDTRFGQGTLPHGMRAVVAIAAGAFHTVALQDDGTVVAWGSNEFRQTDVPTDLRDVQAIAAGKNFTVTLKSDGTIIIAWGENSYGQINAPAGLKDVQAISAGNDHTVALMRLFRSVSFGNQSVGSRTTKSFVIKNTGTVALSITGLAVIGENAQDFSVDSSDTLLSIAPESETIFTVSFTPTVLGTPAAILRVTSNDTANSIYDVVLTGAATTLPNRFTQWR
jgi:alpha-tubulin suppressor-like RCC1 family protein